MPMPEVDVYDVVKKLIGPIVPVGDSNTDSYRLENLKQLTSVVDRLVIDINGVGCGKDSPFHSVKVAGQHASMFLASIGVGE